MYTLDESWISSVVIVTGYGLDGWSLIPGRGKIFLFSIASNPALGSTQPPIQWVLEALSPGVKLLGHEDDYSPPASAEVKNDGAIVLPPIVPSWRNA
jgi:hypothetical protein